jgi:hypothetical protein
MNKKGQIYFLYLVFVVIAMIGMVVGILGNHMKEIHASVVSPLEVLEVRDGLERFENSEEAYIKNALVLSGGLGSPQFHESFRNNFLNFIYNDEETREFLFSNLTIGGSEIDEVDKDFNLIKNIIYAEDKSSVRDDQFIFVRSKIGKREVYKVDNDNDINFPMKMEFEFDREYLITFEDGGYVVEVLE